MKEYLISVKILSNIFNYNIKVCYFIGLPSIGIVRAIFEYISPHVPNSHSIVPLFQLFVMVLMKLRLSLLSSVFNVNVSRYFQKWISVMFWILKSLVKWPDMNNCFKLCLENLKRILGSVLW